MLKSRVPTFAVALGILAIVGILVFVSYSSPGRPATPSPNGTSPNGSGKEYVIELLPDGFSPKDITINRGDTLTFVTKNNQFFWPASDPHPVHSTFADFDPGEPIDPKESWSFTFLKVGTWKYHDHLSPYFTGTVTVLDDEGAGSASPPQGQINCTDNPSATPCIKEKILATMEKKGVEAALDEVALLYKTEVGMPMSCHEIAHDLGHAAYALYQRTGELVFTPKAAYCANGFYHGFVDSLLGATRDIAKTKAFCDRVGKELGATAPDAELQCYHGIGHGAIASTIKKDASNETEIVDPAIRLCEQAATTDNQLYRCVSGIFNDLALFYIHKEHGLSMDPKNPLWYCAKQPEKYKESCYGNMNTALFTLAESSVDKAAAYIVTMEDRDHREMAMRYLMSLAALRIAKEDPQSAIDSCRRLPPELRAACIEGFAHGLLEHGTPGKEYLDMLSFCENTILTKEERDVCLNFSLYRLGGWYSKEQALVACLASDPAYHDMCKKYEP